MKTYLKFLFLLLLALTFFNVVPCESEKNAKLYTHFQLVYSWPNTFCLNKSVQCVKPVPQDFMLHGLWPADKAGKSLLHCSHNANISKALKKHERQLTRAWSSLRKDRPNMKFWGYQWNKHGSCARMKVEEYLQLIIAQNGKYKLLRALSAKDIHPDNSSFYRRSNVEAAIKQEIRAKNFYLSCENYRNGTLIREIMVCLDSYGKRAISCPQSNNSRGCGNKMELVFPAAII